MRLTGQTLLKLLATVRAGWLPADPCIVAFLVLRFRVSARPFFPGLGDLFRALYFHRRARHLQYPARTSRQQLPRHSVHLQGLGRLGL